MWAPVQVRCSCRLFSAIFAVLFALLAFANAQSAPSSPVAAENQAEPAALPHDSVLTEMDRAVDQVAEKVLPAVVQITITGFGHPEDDDSSSTDSSIIERERALGSGVIVDPDGYIMTNAHVVAGAQRIRVLVIPTNSALIPYQTSFAAKQRSFNARLVGMNRQADLALLKIDATGLPYIPLNDDFRVQLGQLVLAIGSPLGLDHTITRGIVSAVGRQPEPDMPFVYIQTDAPINPGNSGGALVDRNGNLLGINTFIYSKSGGSEGLGFAIPQPVVRFVYHELREYGHVRQTYIGATAQTINSDLAAGLKLPQDWGVIISDVVPGGPADKAGLMPEDIVVSFDGRPMDSMPKFFSQLYLHKHGEPVQLEVLRGKEKKAVQIEAIEAPAGVDKLSDLIDQNSLIVSLGIFAVDFSKSVTEALPNLRSSSGIVVVGKTDYDPQIDADLDVGDVIRFMNKKPVGSVTQLRNALDRMKPGDPVVLQVERDGQFRYVTFEIE